MSDPSRCADCDPPSSSTHTQPANALSMAHSPQKADHRVGLPQENFSPPVPIDPPGKAGHATEYTFKSPPTPQLEREKKEVETEPEHSHEGVQKGDLTPPGVSSGDKKTGKDGEGGVEATFEAPRLGEVKPSVIIEFCDRCRWAPRATWIQTELFLTFPNPLLRSITLMPLNAPETGGRFRVWLDFGKGKGDELVWDRKTEGGFPELKVLKQRIRNIIQPDLNLGHSDAHGKQDKPKEQETGLAN